MKYFRLLTIGLLALFGCQSDSTISHDSLVVATRTPIAPIADNRLLITVPNFIISVPQPKDWYFFRMEDGLVLVETNTTTLSHSPFDRMMFHIWIQPIDELVTEDYQSPQAIFEQITLDPAYIGQATVTDPQAFKWGELDASYYILDNQGGNISLIIGLMLPNTAHLIAINLSAPLSQADYLRIQAPLLLDNILINRIPISGAILDQVLPDSLSIPQRMSD